MLEDFEQVASEKEHENAQNKLTCHFFILLDRIKDEERLHVKPFRVQNRMIYSPDEYLMLT